MAWICQISVHKTRREENLRLRWEKSRYNLEARKVAMFEDLRIFCRYSEWFAPRICLASSFDLSRGDDACRAPDIFMIFAKLVAFTEIKHVLVGI
jgi:hypothetical protein